MNRRTLTIIILSLLILLLIIGIIYFIFFFKAPATVTPKPTTSQPSTTGQLASSTTVNQAQPVKNTSAQPATSEELTQFTLKKMAGSFAERLGSYSNQSNFSNILDLKVFMTASAQKWADSYVANARKTASYSGIYQGVTARAISEDVINFNDAAGTAQITVHTQKIESSGTTSNSSTFYEDILITFAKENGQWKIDMFKWQGKK